MTTYSIAAPDGKTYTIEGPKGATQEQVQAEVLKQHPNAGNPPEKGNMFTQSAEDIQYDPVSGVPLNTSSYGSSTGTDKGLVGQATDYSRKALTTAAALPINVATGVAKNVGGLAQTFNRYFGGESQKGNLSKPEEMLNAINQIETGTQQQAGSPNLLKGASMVGQAAPYLAGGSALQIGKIPSYVTNIGRGITEGFVSGLATPEELGLTPEQFRSEKNKNIAIQSALGGAFPAIGESYKALRGAKLTPQMEAAVAEARQAGYNVPPTQAGGGVINRLLEGLAGKASTLQEASVRNQDVTSKLAKQSLGLSEDTFLTPDLLKSIRDNAGQAYENLKLSGTVKTSPKFIQALDNIKPYQDAVRAAKDFPDEAANPIIKVIDSLKRPNFDVNSAVSKINLLRNDADIAFRKGDTALAKANKDASQVLENTIENHLANTNQTQLLDKFRDARKLIAKSYEVEKAMNAKTGSVNAQKLASRLQSGKPLTDELKQIAEFGLAFPKAAQTSEKIGGTIGLSPLDYTVAGLTGAGSYLGGEDKGTTALNAAIALGVRPAARKAVLSDFMQNRLVQQQAAPAGIIRQALPSYDEAKQLAKLLVMQRSGSSSEKKK